MSMKLHSNYKPLPFYLKPRIMDEHEFVEVLNNFVPEDYEDDRMSDNEIERFVCYLLEPDKWMTAFGVDAMIQANSLKDDFQGLLNLDSSGSFGTWKFKYNFDDENVNVDFSIEDADFSSEDGFPYITVTCSGDGQPEFCFFIYINDKNMIKVYVPTKGNTWVKMQERDEGLKYSGVVVRYDSNKLKNEWGYDYVWSDLRKVISRNDYNYIVSKIYKQFKDDMDFDDFKKLFIKYFRISQENIKKLKNRGMTDLVNLIGEIRECFMEYLSYEVELDLSACREEFLSVSHPV